MLIIPVQWSDCNIIASMFVWLSCILVLCINIVILQCISFASAVYTQQCIAAPLHQGFVHQHCDAPRTNTVQLSCIRVLCINIVILQTNAVQRMHQGFMHQHSNLLSGPRPHTGPETDALRSTSSSLSSSLWSFSLRKCCLKITTHCDPISSDQHHHHLRINFTFKCDDGNFIK